MVSLQMGNSQSSISGKYQYVPGEKNGGSSVVRGHGWRKDNCGVIENDFHDRKDLTPNVCAVYVEEDCRNQGIAGRLLQFACEDMENRGVNTLYLLTDHTRFYERYGWEFLCMVQGDGEEYLSRIYRFIKS